MLKHVFQKVKLTLMMCLHICDILAKQKAREDCKHARMFREKDAEMGLESRSERIFFFRVE